MKKTLILISLIFFGLIGVQTVSATQTKVPVNLETPGTNKVLLLPEKATNSRVISLGTAIDPESGLVVEGLMFIHHRDSFAKGGNGKGGNNGDTTSSCYSFLASGARWKNTEDYLIDPTNNEGIDHTTVQSLVNEGLNIWDQVVPFDIFGNQVAGLVDGVETQSPDGKNEVMFGDISSNGTIGVTTVWGIFGGRPSNRQLVEWDMVLNDVDFDWSAEEGAVPGKMDLLNIFVHESGHALGLGHPSDSCIEETMFRFADNGEIQKRDLNIGDIAGVESLY